jgi:putative ABC transport system substrate-binding protein
MKGQTASPPRLGLLLHRGRDALFEGFMSAMSERGHVEGQTITIEPRFAEGVLERTAGLAEDLVRRNVELIVAIGAVGARAARNATSTIPIVFAIVLDPVDTGFAASLERPGGNMTGVTNYDPGLALA